MDVVNDTFVESVDSIISSDLMINITFVLFILLAGFVVGKIVGVALLKLLNGISFDKGVRWFYNSKFLASKTISSTVSWLIYIATVIFALFTLNILSVAFLVVLYFISFLVLGMILLGLFFSIPNFFAGFKLRKYNDLKEVKTKILKGEIIKIGLFNTYLKGSGGELFVVPNKRLLKEKRGSRKSFK